MGRGAIKCTTDISKLKASINERTNAILQKAIMDLMYIGEEAVRIAREEGNYEDHTQNLRSSIGYTVLLNGQPVRYGQPNQNQTDEGVHAADALLSILKTKYPKGLVLIVCAGMNYAEYVEARGYNVLTSAELKAQQLAHRLMKRLAK